MHLSIIIVTYNSVQVIQKCIQSVYSSINNQIEFEVIVIDNNSKDSTLDLLNSMNLSNLIIFANTTNIGFAKACNQGFRNAKSNVILLLNPDTFVVENAIVESLNFLAVNKEIGVVGCRILYPDGKIQYSCRRFPKLFDLLSMSLALYKLFPKSRIFGQLFMTDFDYNSNRKVDVVNGSFFMLKQELIEEVGYFDEDYFMYSEEMDYCYRISKTKWVVYFFSDATVHHNLGHSAYQADNDVKMFTQLHISRNLFYNKHFSSLKSFLFRMIGLVETGIRFIFWFLIKNVQRNDSNHVRYNRYKNSFFWYLKHLI